MLLKTAMKTMRRNISMNILSILQMTAALLIASVMVSAICIRYQTYTPFQDYFEGHGLFCKFTTPAHDGDLYDMSTRIESSEALLSYLSASSALTAHELILTVDDGSENGAMPKAISYDDEIIRRYQPSLQDGRWLSTEAEEIEIVISENAYGWKVGDIIPFAVGGDDQMLLLEGRVVGVLRDNAEVFGLFRSRNDESDEIYRLLYDSYSFGIEGKPLMLFSYSTLERLEPSPLQSIYSSVLLSYPNDTSSETMKKDQQTLNRLGCVMSIDLQTMDVNSKHYLYYEMYRLLPIVAVLMVLVLVSSISSSALSTRRRLRDYAIFYLNGLQWKQCMVVNLLQAFLTGAAAVLLTICGVAVVRFSTLSDTFRILWNGWVVVVLAGMLLVYLLLSMLMPVMMLYSTTPARILKGN